MIEFTPEQEKTIETALNTYGYMNQIDKAIEEMAELTKALLKHRANATARNLDHVVEEIADVAIMLEQLMMIFDDCGGCFDVNETVYYKIKRLEKRLNRENNVAQSNINE